MNANSVVTKELGEHNIVATYGGNDISRHWSDPFLEKVLVDAYYANTSQDDLFDFANFIFSYVTNMVNRRWNGSVTVKSLSVKSTATNGREVVSYS